MNKIRNRVSVWLLTVPDIDCDAQFWCLLIKMGQRRDFAFFCCLGVSVWAKIFAKLPKNSSVDTCCLMWTWFEKRTKMEVKRLRGSYEEMFSPVLSHLAAEATSYYVWALAVTIIIITRRLELKNRSAHLADELPNDLLKKEMAPGQPTCQHSLPPSLTLSLSFSCLRFCFSHPLCLCRTFSVKLCQCHFWKVVDQWNDMHAHTHIQPIFVTLEQSQERIFFPLINTHRHTKNAFIHSVCTCSCPFPLLRTHRPSDLTNKKNLSHSPSHIHTHSTLLPGVKPHWVLLHLVMWLRRSCIILTTPCRDREMEREREKEKEWG